MRSESQPGRAFFVLLALHLVLLLVPISPSAAEQPLPDLRLRVVEAPQPTPDFGDLSVRIWSGDAWTTFPLQPVGEPESGHLVAPQTCSPGSVATVVSANWVSEPFSLSSDDCRPGQVLRIRLLPRATVHGKLVAPDDEVLPSVAELRAEPCPEAARSSRLFARSIYLVEVDEEGAWSSPVPTGCVHLTLTVGELAPLSWWRMALLPGTSKDLGTRRPRSGGSVLVRVVSGADGRALKGARVELLPESAASNAWIPQRDEALVEREGSTGRGGWLRLAGLAPGSYVLRLQHPEHPEIFTVTPAFELSRREAVFDDLEIPEPARLVVDLEKASELPLHAEVLVSVFPRIGGNKLYPAERHVATPLGEPAVLDELHPGTWSVHLILRADELGSQEVAYREVTLIAGEERRLQMAAELPLYQGEVSLRGEPVAAELRFQSRKLAAGVEEAGMSRNPTSRSDEEGTFAVFLPGAGTYQVTVQGEERSASLPRVDVGEPDEPLHIRLPEGQLSGRVVGTDGLPAPGARVTAQLLDLQEKEMTPAVIHRFTKAKAGGAFEIDALGEGLWEVKAEKGERRSTTLEIPLAPNQTLPGVELVLRQPYQVTGRVRTESGRPVPSAEGSLLVDPRDVGILSLGHRFRTGMDGRFSVELVERPEHPVHLLFGGGGTPLTTVRRRPTGPLDVTLPERGGGVEIRVTGAPETSSLVVLALLRRPDGAVLPPAVFTELHQMRREGADTEWILPTVAPGRWQLVLPHSMEEVLAAITGVPLPAAAAFEVLPGQTVQVEAEMGELGTGTTPDRE